MENNNEKTPENKSNIKLILAASFSLLGLILIFSSKKKKDKNDNIVEIKPEKEKTIVINNYINKDEVKNHGKTKSRPAPKPDDKPADFVELDPITGKNKSDDSGNE